MSVSSLNGTYQVEDRDETRKNWDMPYHLMARPDDRLSERNYKLGKFENWCEDFSLNIPDASFAMRNLVLEMLDKIRTIMPEVDLPPGFINPIEELAEALRTNILEGPKPFLTSVYDDEVPL